MSNDTLNRIDFNNKTRLTDALKEAILNLESVEGNVRAAIRRIHEHLAEVEDQTD